MITVGNGSNDLIEFVSKCFLSEGDNAIYSQHGFAIYPLAIKSTGAKAIKAKARDWGHDLNLMKDLVDENTKVIFLATPNNPTGTVLESSDIEEFLEVIPSNIAVFVDQAYFEYIEEDKYKISFNLVKKYKNLIISRSFSKAHGLAALRLGYAVSSEEIAEFLNRVRQPFNTNSLALAAGVEAVKYIESFGNFISFDSQMDSDSSFDFFLRKGIILRSLKVYEMPQHLRVSIGLDDEMDAFIKALKQYKKAF